MSCSLKADKRRRLSDDDVRQILALVADGMSQRQAAEQFNIHPSSVSDITCGRTYTHIERKIDLKPTPAPTNQACDDRLTRDEYKQITRANKLASLLPKMRLDLCGMLAVHFSEESARIVQMLDRT